MPVPSPSATRGLDPDCFRAEHAGPVLTRTMLEEGVRRAYAHLDGFDLVLATQLPGPDAPTLAGFIDLATYSSLLGGFLVRAIIDGAAGAFALAAPNRYQDLRSTSASVPSVEVKVAFEDNKPKAHRAEGGAYLTVRYVLGDADGTYVPSTRGGTCWIWEIRYGELAPSDFRVSDTDGDSGKTAVVSTSALEGLSLVYADPARCPYARGGAKYRDLVFPRLALAVRAAA